jgi:DNA-directed RNA polymerase specialized sigma24 family protein
MTLTPPWDSLQDGTVFQEFFKVYEWECRQATHPRYRRLAAKWSISASEYELMVSDSIVDSFVSLRLQWDKPSTDRTSPLAFLVTAAQRCLFRRLQKAIQHLRMQVDVPTLTLPALSAGDTSMQVVDILSRIHPRQAQALEGRYVHDRTIRDLAASLDTTEAGLQSLLQRGRSRFRSMWQDADSQPHPGGAL